MTTIRELMVQTVVAIHPHNSVRDVARVLQNNHIHGAPVIDASGELVGVVTTADLVPGMDPEAPVSALLDSERPVWRIGPDATPRDAACRMRKGRVHHLPVVEEGRLLGIVSSFDLLKALCDG